MYKLSNVLRPYAWGSHTAIAELLGRQASGGPEAELWIGAHPDASSTLLLADGAESSDSLEQLISAHPSAALGEASRAAFGDRLPFLMKVLAASQALSLQVHPHLAQAAAGFRAAEEAGVPRNAEYRNYKDDNHKPEMIFALSPFEALCGFRPVSQSAEIFEQLERGFRGAGIEPPAILHWVIEDLRSKDSAIALRNAFERLISGGQEVRSAVNSVAELLHSGTELAPFQTELETVLSLDSDFPGDPGALISLLMNRVHLEPGECFAMQAGNVHAYLQGLGIEVMASSDNVLRGGLTSKFIDVPELLKTVDFQELPVPMVQASVSALGQELYVPGFTEFQLQRVELGPNGSPVPLAQNGALLVLLVSGKALLDSPRGDLELERGESAFIPATEAPVMLHSIEGCTAFAVTTGLGLSV
ncbi:mannose-6-phosphate isomerase [Psychromicrobium silvestre]|uniref:mannose-6-phosphate isomerase n=1 Tax=Psychromicrobium silvestre TaxID=1645614 RepID=A0A7Y9LVX2_9MICC|nr:mannose-6-phosphate isomerase, class I [Psychromicrobium silvestre]NYE96541.1 mannose-6-phosphate isomerase [Psychromicrobium silvestre]